MQTDEQLLQDYAETGSQESFSELYNRHFQGLVRNLQSRYLRKDPSSAEDVAQSTFSEIAQNPSNFVGRSFAGLMWSRGAARAINLNRDSKNRAKNEGKAAHAESYQDADVGDMLDLLPDLEREVLTRHIVGGESLKELAVDFQMNYETLKSKTRRSIKKLRTELCA